ncbi:Uncharacterised protein [Mycobacteroides abscessus subsp. abscessus]|nr:Uncharacterised protein [Mycobacteroides abscessus subsp. abscessus]
MSQRFEEIRLHPIQRLTRIHQKTTSLKRQHAKISNPAILQASGGL